MKIVEFDYDEVRALAVFLCELERQGATYTVRKTVDGWVVELTGGF